MTPDIPSFVELGESVIYQKLQGEIVLLNMENQNYYGLDEVGAEMWQTLMERKSVALTVDELTKIYDAGAGVLRRDLENLVCNLMAAGLLRGGSPHAAMLIPQKKKGNIPGKPHEVERY